MNGDRRELISLIEKAFVARPRPKHLYFKDPTQPKQISDSDLADIIALDTLDWSVVDIRTLDRLGGASGFLTPDAFCYFLPKIMVATLRLNAADSSIVSFIFWSLAHRVEKIEDLMESASRLSGLDANELNALKLWLWWVLEESDTEDDHQIGHAIDVVDLFINRKTDGK